MRTAQMTETIFEKNVFDVYLGFLFSSVSTNMEEAGFMTCAAASHQVVIKTQWDFSSLANTVG